MSASNVPEGLKSIVPYLQRASQLQEREPIVAYFSNYYAAKLAIPKVGKDNDNRIFIAELLDTLEKQRKQIDNNEVISNDLVGYAYIENFALRIFTKADDEDRAGQGSQKTAKNFVAAANFLELLKVFGEIDADVEKKIKYSKWRAAEIVKAIRDGRQPVPPPGADKPKEASPDMNSGLEGFGSLDVSGNAGSNIGDANNTVYSPTNSANIPPTTQAGNVYNNSGGAPGFPNITNFPSPPLGSSNQGNFTDSNQGNFTDGYSNSNVNMDSSNTWVQPGVSPTLNMNQNIGQNYYNPVAPTQPQQPPVSNYIPSPTMPNSNYMSTVPNPTSPLNNSQYGYGANNLNNNNLYQQPTIPSPSPAPTQSQYGQSGYSHQPSAPYQQPQSSPAPYAPAPIIVDPAINAQVQKHCKWTVSALTYDDIPTAVENLEKALALLRPYHNKS